MSPEAVIPSSPVQAVPAHAGADAGVGPVFELISAFGESADARLRGNAVYALAALARRCETTVRERARDALRAILVAAPAGGGSADWQRAFAERALDALAELEPTDRAWLRDALLGVLSSSADPAQRQWIARFALAASEPPRHRFEPGGWWQYLRLTWAAGRPLFWNSLWAGIWRTGWVWVPLLIAIMSMPKTPSGAEASGFLWLWSAGCMGLLAVVSLAGRIVPPRRVQFADIALAGVLFGGLVGGLPWLAPDVIGDNAAALWLLVLLGALVGALVRSLRWITVSTDTEPSGMATLLRPLAAFALTTLACQCAALFVGVRPMATAWLVLAPAGAVAAWLDVWLDLHGPRVQLAQPRTRREWLLPVLTGSAVLLVLVVGYVQAIAIEEMTKGRSPIELPGALKEQPLVVQTHFNTLVPLDVQQDGDYTITGGDIGDVPRAIKRDGIDHVLVILDDKYGVVDEEDEPEPPTLTLPLVKGRYYVCIARATKSGCLVSRPGATDSRLLTAIGTVLTLALDNKRRYVSMAAATLPSPPGEGAK